MDISKFVEFLKPMLIALGFGFGFWQMYKYDYSFVSLSGMDDFGRQLFCQNSNAAFNGAENIRIRCLGGTNRIFRISMSSSDPIFFGSLSINGLKEQMQRPFEYNETGEAILVLRGSEESGRITESVSMKELSKKLKDIGVYSLADLYAALGFQSYSVVAEDTDTKYLEFVFSAEQMGDNPVEIIE